MHEAGLVITASLHTVEVICATGTIIEFLSQVGNWIHYWKCKSYSIYIDVRNRVSPPPEETEWVRHLDIEDKNDTPK